MNSEKFANSEEELHSWDVELHIGSPLTDVFVINNNAFSHIYDNLGKPYEYCLHGYHKTGVDKKLSVFGFGHTISEASENAKHIALNAKID